MSGNSAAATASAPEGIVRVNRQGVLIIRTFALSVMLVPLAGFIEAIRLWATGHAAVWAFVLFAVMYCIQMAGVSIGFHRMLAHKAFETSTFLKFVFGIAGSIAAQGPVFYWVATHRRHHAYSDREGDPHSPNLFGNDWKSKLRGLWYAHMPWMLSEETSSWARYARDVMDDKVAFFLHRTYFVWIGVGLAVPAAIGWFIEGTFLGAWVGFIFGGLARMFLANQLAWCVGSVCHMFGSRPFQTPDNSTNSWWVALLTFGEGLQNNHHAFPWWHRHAVKWWEPDISGWLLSLFGRMGLVWGLKSPSPTAIERLRKRDDAAPAEA